MTGQAAAQGRTPIWVPIVLGFQLFLTIIIFGLSAYIIHGVYFNTLGYVIFLCLLTWLLVAYHFLTIYVASLQKFRFPYVALSTNAGMVVFWLAAMGSAAALRASFIYDVTIESCYNNGKTINSSTCTVSKRNLQKRAAVATPTGLAIMSAIAGLSALVLITYIACLVVEIISWNKTRKRSSPLGGATAPQKQGEAGYEGYRMEAPQQPVHVAPMQQHPHQQAYDPQQGYAQQPYQGIPSPQPQQNYAQQPYQGSPSPQPQQPYQGTTSPPPQQSYVHQPPVQQPQGQYHEMPHGEQQQHQPQAGPYNGGYQ